ncbi:DUF4266 domain-containing protein [Salinispirillum sp. LH 10-3-1]|uniref:DUF4266 domain-containing protein n=1 Tax=Salinispirillum sp. LH 10-3-1 TaxID=2952525 RepID=A0AB38YDR3_9GAMM
MRIASLLTIAFLLTLTGCAQVPVWERGALAQPGMEIDGHPVDTYVDSHIYFSKEAATGGSGVGGGGCGCN